MVSRRLKVSLMVTIFLALGFLSASFFVGTEAPTENQVVSNTALTANLVIDLGGEVQGFEIEPHGENLFVLMRNKFEERGVSFAYETFTGLGELMTRIGDQKNGAEGKYWQFWINGTYSQVGASSYIPKAGDTIEWKFTNEQQ